VRGNAAHAAKVAVSSITVLGGFSGLVPVPSSMFIMSNGLLGFKLAEGAGRGDV
jgi:hypothetical protein